MLAYEPAKFPESSVAVTCDEFTVVVEPILRSTALKFAVDVLFET